MQESGEIHVSQSVLLFALTVDARVGWDSCFTVYTKNTILYVH